VKLAKGQNWDYESWSPVIKNLLAPTLKKRN
jgi:hypothetical protein